MLSSCGQQYVQEEQIKEKLDSATAIIAEVINNPDGAVGKCENIEKTEDKQTCYSTYMAVKADQKEGFDVAICDKIKPENKENCNLYLALIKTQNPE